MKDHPIALRFPAMGAAEFDALVLDIAAHGLREPIVLYRGEILDGRHRYRACLRLGIEPRVVTHIGDDESARSLADSLNIHRRHLTITERRQLVMEELKRDPQQADRVIARKANVDHVTVAKVRREAADAGEVHHQAVRIGADGVAQPAKRKYTPPPGHAPRTERIEQIKRLVEGGHIAPQVAVELGISEQQVRKIAHEEGIVFRAPKMVTRINPLKVVTETVNVLAGCAHGVSLVLQQVPSLNPGDASTLLRDLRDAMKHLRALESKLKEASNV